MKKTYICPQLLVVRLNTTHNILTLSGGANGTLIISDDDVISTPGSVWTRENRGSVWDEEW